MTMTLKAAIEQAGKVSLGNGKMPGSTFAISATQCNVGGKLAQIKNSTCSRCYALRLEKLRPSVHQGWMANYTKATKQISANPETWAKAAAFQITRAWQKSGQAYHRWFDSGDLQSVEMLDAIARAARLTPEIRHWLPTREAAIVKAWLKSNKRPSNLIIRVSATMIGDAPSNAELTSTVHRHGETHNGKECVAYRTKENGGVLTELEHKTYKALTKEQRDALPFTLGHCGDCRACWSDSVKNISYPLH